jgi:WD40 repeat protein
MSLTNTPLLLIGGLRGFIKVISCTFGEIETVLIGHGNAVNELKTHPVSPALVLSASRDESIRLWNVYTSCCIAIFAGDQGHRDQVLSIDFHMLGNCFASSGMDNTVKVWSLEGRGSNNSDGGGGGKIAQNIAKSFSYSTTHVNNVNVSAAGGGHETLYKGPIHEQFPLYSSSQIHSDYVDCVRWLGNLLLSKSTNNKIIMWKPNVFAIHGHSGVASLYKVKKLVKIVNENIKEKAAAAEEEDVQEDEEEEDDDDEDEEEEEVEPSGICFPPKPGAATTLREFNFRDAEIWLVFITILLSLSSLLLHTVLF